MHHVRQRLQHEKNSRLAQLNAIEADRVKGNAELAAVQTNAIRLVLTEIAAAEDRLNDGSYGNCSSCATPIPVERLEILPYVRYCVSCQQRSS